MLSIWDSLSKVSSELGIYGPLPHRPLFQTNAKLLSQLADAGYVDVARDYGWGKGTGDDSGWVADAIADVSAKYGAGTVVLVPGKTFQMHDVPVLSGIHVIAKGATIIKNGGTLGIFNATGSLTATASTLTADAAIADTQLQLTSVAGFAIGDIILIADSTWKNTAGHTGQNQEMCRVYDIIGNALDFGDKRLVGKYLMANSAIVTKLNAIDGSRIEGGKFIIPNGVGGGGIRGVYCMDSEVTGVTVDGMNTFPGIRFDTSQGILIDGNRLRNAQNRNSGGGGPYSIALHEGCMNCLVTRNKITNVRETTFTNNTRYCSFIANQIEGCYDDAFNTHGSGCEHIIVALNTVDGSRAPGIIIGFNGSVAYDQDILVFGNTVVNVKSHAFYTFGGNSTTQRSQRIAFIGNTAKNFGLGSVFSWAGIFADAADDVIIEDNHIDGGPGASAGFGVFLLDVTDAIVAGNKISNIPNYGIQLQSTTDCLVENNKLKNILSYNIRSVTSNINLEVRHNVADDNLVNKLAGEFYHDNRWGTKYDDQDGTTAAVTDGATVAHSLVAAPTWVQAQTTVAGEFASVTALAAGTFTVAIKKHDGTAGTSQTIHWAAKTRP